MDAEKLRATLAATSALRSRAEMRTPWHALRNKTQKPSAPLIGFSLTDALLIVCDELGHSAERQQLLAALPLVDDDLNPIAAPLALSRVDLHGAWSQTAFKSYTSQSLPAILKLTSGGYIVALKMHDAHSVHVRAAGFTGVWPVRFLREEVTAPWLMIQTSAAAAVSSATALQSSRFLWRDVWASHHVRESFPVVRMAGSALLLSLLMLMMIAVMHLVAHTGSGSLLTIPLAACLSAAAVFVLHHWRKQRDSQVMPCLVSHLRHIFLRGCLMRQMLNKDDIKNACAQATHQLVSALRLPLIDLPVAIFALMITAITSPAWMVEAYLPALMLLTYACVALHRQRKRAADLRRLCRAMTYAETTVRERIRGDLALDNATVVDAAAQPLMTHVNVRIRSGERVGIIGATGAGKTSLLRMLAGHYALEEGRRFVDGQPLASQLDLLRNEQIFYAPQETTLIEGTLAENILMGRPQPLPGMLDWVARVCNLSSLLARGEGWNQRISSADVLSAGERQAIGLARALAGDPVVLLLDDPTAAMDAQSERAFLSGLVNDTTQRTLVIASNRQSVLRMMDRIIWVDQGRIYADKPSADILQNSRPSAPRAMRNVA